MIGRLSRTMTGTDTDEATDDVARPPAPPQDAAAGGGRGRGGGARAHALRAHLGPRSGRPGWTSPCGRAWPATPSSVSRPSAASSSTATRHRSSCGPPSRSSTCRPSNGWPARTTSRATCAPRPSATLARIPSAILRLLVVTLAGGAVAGLLIGRRRARARGRRGRRTRPVVMPSWPAGRALCSPSRARSGWSGSAIASTSSASPGTRGPGAGTCGRRCREAGVRRPRRHAGPLAGAGRADQRAEPGGRGHGAVARPGRGAHPPHQRHPPEPDGAGDRQGPGHASRCGPWSTPAT